MALSLDNSNNLPSSFSAGAIIYIAGKPSKYLYIIKRGNVRLMKVVNNHLHVVQICNAGDILNDISVLTSKNLDHCAIAYGDVEVAAIEASEVRSVIKKCPKWIPDIFATLCERLLDSQEIIYEHNLNVQTVDKSLVLSKEEEKILLNRILDFKA